VFDRGDEEAISNLINEELDIDSDNELDFEIDACSESSEEHSGSESETDTSAATGGGLCDDGWRVVTARDSKPQEYIFSKRSGQKVNLQLDAKPIEYFNLLFSDELINEIVIETNRYAKERISNLQLSSRSIWSKWHEVTTIEIKAFLGIVINMGMIPLPDMKDYWSNEWTTEIKFFCDVMPRDRFLQIFWMLHVGSDAINETNTAIKRTKKVHGVIEHIEKNFQQHFVPGKNISIDESTVGFKGKILFKTYNPKKPTKWGLRLFVLADSETGYVHSIIPYYGKVTGDICNLPYPEKSFTSRIVLSLIKRLEISTLDIEGYHLFTDRYYSSVELARELNQRKCHATGTIIAGRVGNPKPVRQGTLKKMKSGDVVAYRSDSVMVMGWKDKRPVIMVSTYHDTSMKKVSTIQKGGQQKDIMKPVCVLDYTKNMGGVDRNDHYCATYAFVRKSLKWWRKLFFWCLEVSIVNAYILYSCHQKQSNTMTMSHLKFRRSLVESLVRDVRNPRKRSHPGSAEREERLNQKPHFLYHFENKKHKDCIVCSNRKIKGARKESYFYCKTCTNHPAMCPGECFERYHTQVIYKRH
jgi:hypothetical protein